MPTEDGCHRPDQETNAKNGEAKRETQITKKPRHSHQSWETMNGTKGRNEDKRLRWPTGPPKLLGDKPPARRQTPLGCIESPNSNEMKMRK